ncbi:hypothetical protein K7711_00105 [Nocardia sp. CA2R105]|uniref:hypothetical protein n=1 Tax=Nocardia coffeae TaxID=2873381 RepID=UPI001CA609A7|nr:hypothetical protein [Nocardia coffeae]MBY8854872.1 hypothetical protein [Nocardia coffeae]
MRNSVAAEVWYLPPEHRLEPFLKAAAEGDPDAALEPYAAQNNWAWLSVEVDEGVIGAGLPT